MTKRLYGLIGFPISHSFSKQYFTQKFEREGIADAEYRLFPLKNVADFPILLAQNPQLKGLNVTIPHKSAIMPFLDALDECASSVGAINCIDLKNGKTTGYNTDVIGFEQSLLRVYPLHAKNKALVLGTGGAAKAVQWVLRAQGIPAWFAARDPRHEQQIPYAAIKDLDARAFDLIVNTTPVGTWPDTNHCPPLPLSFLHEGQLVFDLIYNPTETLLLRHAAAQGCRIQNGLEMLHLQAEAAWKIWT